MIVPRVTSEFWVSAYKRLLDSLAIPIFVVQRGNAKAGAVLVRVSDLQGTSKLFIQSYDLEGDIRWVELALGKDHEMDKVIVRQREVDPDLWVLEVEARDGQHHLDKVLS